MTVAQQGQEHALSGVASWCCLPALPLLALPCSPALRHMACSCACARTGHLQVDAAGHGAALVMHIEEGLNLWQGVGVG